MPSFCNPQSRIQAMVFNRSLRGKAVEELYNGELTHHFQISDVVYLLTVQQQETHSTTYILAITTLSTPQKKKSLSVIKPIKLHINPINKPSIKKGKVGYRFNVATCLQLFQYNMIFKLGLPYCSNPILCPFPNPSPKVHKVYPYNSIQKVFILMMTICHYEYTDFLKLYCLLHMIYFLLCCTGIFFSSASFSGSENNELQRNQLL